ncbi:MAG: DUF2508 family protein [Clostridia bacterium]|nr:DUF2508 family protein [Clostridia bacterium]
MKSFYEIVLKKIMKKPISEEEIIIESINNALIELNYAKNNFDMVVGADNVELAILELNTAEKRFENLIKEAKHKGLNRLSGTDRIFGDLPTLE